MHIFLGVDGKRLGEVGEAVECDELIRSDRCLIGSDCQPETMITFQLNETGTSNS